MDLKLVKNILTLISESDVDEVSIEEGDFKIKVKKNTEKTIQSVQYQPQAQAQYTPSPAPLSEPKPVEKSVGQSGGEVVKSPIVGTFYEASSPESDPYVKEGDRVQKGDTLCIIEAMKIMNEIESEFSGTIEKIVVSDGSPVEFDQPLFIIKKD